MSMTSMAVFGLSGCNGNPLTSSGGSSSSAVVVSSSDPASDPISSNDTSAQSSATLYWSAPVEKENGEPLASNELTGYQIYYGRTGNPYENVINVDSPYSTSYTINGLSAGEYVFSIVAIDSNGRTSSFSNTISKSIG